jgi:hypothetical protein
LRHRGEKNIKREGEREGLKEETHFTAEMGQTSSNLGENGPPGATQVRRVGRARDPQDKAAICR